MDTKVLHESINEIREWQKDNPFEETLVDTKSISKENRRLKKEYIQLILSMLRDNIEQWECGFLIIRLKIKNYVLEVGDYGVYEYEDYRMKVFAVKGNESFEIFNHQVANFSKEKRAIKKALRKVAKLYDIKKMSEGNELMSEAFGSLKDRYQF